MINPIDKDKTADEPGLLSYPHTIGSVVIKPEDVGKIKSRALTSMREQTARQLAQIQKQAELLAQQAKAIQQRIEISENIYRASISFEPFTGSVYHLYKKNDDYVLMLIGPDEWGKTMPEALRFVCSAVLLSDHTWDIVHTNDFSF